RCLLETFFTLPEGSRGDKRAIIERLLVIARRAAPNCRLKDLAGPLMHRVADGGYCDAAFFLSLVPPTVGDT
ncbi:unnamed protein product, partial [Choristocarpus tenellus]